MIAAVISNTKQAEEIKELTDAFIVPVERFSINYKKTFKLEEIKEIKKLNKEVFVVINKNIHNNEVEELKKLLIQIENHNLYFLICLNFYF